MTAHRTLDEFATDAATEEKQPAQLDTTYQWVPDGELCGACGETVTVLWRGDHGLICASCKEW